MENNFNFMNFSFFEMDSLTAMKEAVREVFIQDFQKGKANFIKTPFINSSLKFEITAKRLCAASQIVL